MRKYRIIAGQTLKTALFSHINDILFVLKIITVGYFLLSGQLVVYIYTVVLQYCDNYKLLFSSLFVRSPQCRVSDSYLSFFFVYINLQFDFYSALWFEFLIKDLIRVPFLFFDVN
ncbi:unnamed protein product [Chrysodeixis includens]|uniref:Uncharacterized protein n=1 Tax=Chrysodeixis includens TaxID=689277 RepID=A0A9N8Q0N8_CHRIL|nr:unnamed protein product [Chrysodeixis includens]